ncbi:hypothetical protein COT66_01080 [Candidatus Shapirobacteria bacterium CG09_land_8_20_14_0_10_49_15]|uniref:Uncharacterized protein n=2 Tax=Candidatus Shapironibacteriota TaxID=1752721 RepID=A0A2M8L6Q9_9BACT|nr:MAG: hypothetical protein COT66_01080 [Candidatus Shapirobacteria bacterium CG09_land_8_20_14_0_10_49_15]PJE69911.1 MAG: hypothetical protein COU97_02605 [Candidatus Shapirobacteria bacterium CG10_big_fil_rev_8_21_14_0_10_48_15]
MDGQKLSKFFSRWWLVLILIATALLRFPSLFEPFTYGDEGIYLTLGQALRKGLVFYRDIHDNKPPLLYLLAAVSGSFGHFRLLLFFWSFLTILVFYELCLQLFAKNRRAVATATTILAVLTSLHTFEGNVANAENFMMLPTLFGFYLFVKIRSQPAAFLPWLAIGSLFGLATLFKVPAAFDFIALLALYTTVNRKIKTKFFQNGLFLTAGFSLPILFSFAYYAAKNSLPAYWIAAFSQNLPYLSSWGSDQPQAGSLPIALLTRAGLLAMVVGLIFWQRQKISLAASLAIFWFGFSLFAALLSGRPYPHYLLQTIPPLSLTWGLIFAKKNFAKLIPIGLTLTLITSFLTFKFWHYPNWSYYQNFYQYALGGKDKQAYWLKFGDHTVAIYELARYLQTHTQPEEKIFIWSNQPSVYVLAKRLPVGRYCTAYHIQDFDKQGTSLRQVSAQPPRFVVVEKSLPYPALEALLQTNYLFDQQFGPFAVYHRVITG